MSGFAHSPHVTGRSKMPMTLNIPIKGGEVGVDRFSGIHKYIYIYKGILKRAAVYFAKSSN